MPLTLEHWPAHLRGRASGMMQNGYSLGFLLSALVYQFGYPLVSRRPDLGWRAMLWIGVLPALIAFFVMKNVRESPVWLERQRLLRHRGERDPISLGRLFSRPLLATTLHTSVMMGAFLFMYHSLTYWYPTMLRTTGHAALPFLLAFNAAAIAGALAIGRLSETAVGRRGAAIVATLIGIVTIPMYVLTSNGLLLAAGALTMGFFGAGNFGVVPAYLTERFPTAARAAGAGFAYHVGAGFGSFTPTLVGLLQDRGLALPVAMAACIAASGVVVVILMALGPETRGKQFHALDGQ
jgi:SHS family lactate transporter-like MFS transporter